MGDNTEISSGKYEWNVLLDCAVYPMVYRMERIIEEETSVTTATTTQHQQMQQSAPSPLPTEGLQDARHKEETSVEEVSTPGLSCSATVGCFSFPRAGSG